MNENGAQFLPRDACARERHVLKASRREKLLYFYISSQPRVTEDLNQCVPAVNGKDKPLSCYSQVSAHNKGSIRFEEIIASSLKKGFPMF